MSNKKQHYNIMKTNKPLTAVDWLLQQFDEEKTPRQWEEVYKKAIELEKQQIIDAYNQDLYGGLSNNRKFENGKQYYEDTYGND